VFEGLSGMLRDRNTGGASVGSGAGFGQIPNRDTGDSSTPRNNVI
jgi:hypothetical protein